MLKKIEKNLETSKQPLMMTNEKSESNRGNISKFINQLQPKT